MIPSIVFSAGLRTWRKKNCLKKNKADESCVMILIGNDIAPAVRFFINNRNLLKRIVRTSLMIFQEFVVISANHRSRFSFYGTLKEPAEKLDRFHSFQKIECSNIKRSILIGAEINSFRRDQNGGLNWITKMIQGKNHTSLKKLKLQLQFQLEQISALNLVLEFDQDLKVWIFQSSWCVWQIAPCMRKSLSFFHLLRQPFATY